jgi:hypothetical protein
VQNIRIHGLGDVRPEVFAWFFISIAHDGLPAISLPS